MEASIVVYVAESYLPTRRAIFLAGLLPVMILAEFRPRITHLFGHILSEKMEAFTLIIILAICMYLSTFCPESPVWLKNKNAFEPVDGIEIPDINKANSNGNVHDDQKSEFVVYVRNLGNIYAWKHFIILAGIFTKITLLDVGLSEFLDDYMSELLPHEISSSELFDTYQGGLFSDQVQHLHDISFVIVFISSLIGLCIVEAVDRKMLSGLAWFCVTISSLIGCVYEILFDDVASYYRPTRFCLIPIMCIWASKGFLTIGGRMLVIVMLGELFPSSIRGFISGLLWSFMVMVAFIVEVFVHPFFKSRLSTVWLFAMYAGMGSQMFLVGACIMPETRGRTLMEIERNKGKRVIKKLRTPVITRRVYVDNELDSERRSDDSVSMVERV